MSAKSLTEMTVDELVEFREECFARVSLPQDPEWDILDRIDEVLIERVRDRETYGLS